MRVAVSNIAWRPEDDAEVAEVLVRSGVAGVELAPTAVWAEPTATSDAELAAYRAEWRGRGLALVALQALLYGRPELTLFETDDQRCRALEYLRQVARLGARLGTRALVFGSPKARRVDGKDRDWANGVAVEFFRTAGEYAAEFGVVLCIEPNPPEYGADWITTVAEARALVDRVDHHGFGLHLDLGGMLLAREDPVQEIERSGGRIRHFHVSEPHLAPVGDRAEHAAVAAALRRVDYGGWVSIEMRRGPHASAADQVAAAVGPVVAAYGADV